MGLLALRPWRDDDVDLLRRANTPEMTAHLNGPETEEQLEDRHARYLRYRDNDEARMFAITDGDESVGSIGCWAVRWREQDALETGWFVVPEAQGRGIAVRALTLLLEEARRTADTRRMLVAFPGAENAASNGVCRRAGFELVGTITGSFPRGRADHERMGAAPQRESLTPEARSRKAPETGESF